MSEKSKSMKVEVESAGLSAWILITFALGLCMQVALLVSAAILLIAS